MTSGAAVPRSGDFVGRDEELRELRRSLHDAIAGRGTLVLLSGDPGIGKSRLAGQLEAVARADGLHVLGTRCWEGAGTPPYWPWIQLLRAALRSVPPSAVAEQVGHARASDLAHLLPELRDAVADLPTTPATDPETARFRLFDAASSWLVGLASPAGLVIVIDDLQAADSGSLLLLQFLVSQIATSRIFLVATHRNIELLPDQGLAHALVDLHREPSTRTIHLGGLSVDATETFITSATGGTVASGLAATLHRETAGNPLFIGEAVRLLASEGRLDQVHDPGLLRLAMPPGVREAIAQRVSRLDDEAESAAEIAAVIGLEFSLDVFALVEGHDEDAALALVDRLAREELIAEVPGARGRFRFTHPLIRETLYDALSPARRMRLHRTTAEALETHHATSPEHLAELAMHFFQGARGGEDVDKAVTYARRAADHAASSLGYEEAARLYGTALQALADREQPDDELRGDLMLALGDALARGGELSGARRTFIDAAANARRIGNAAQLATAALGYGGRFIWPRAGDDVLLVPLLEEALEALGTGEPTLRVQLLARLACALRSDPDRSRSEALSAEAVDLARDVGDPRLVAYALSGRWGATWWPENAHARLELARELAKVAEAAADAERMIDGQLFEAMSLLDMCRLVEANAVLERVEQEARALRQPAQAWIVEAERTIIALLQGDWTRADALLERASAPRRPVTPVMDDVSSHRMHRFIRRREQGLTADEEADVRDSIERFPWYPVWHAALVCLLLDAGRTEEAMAAFVVTARDGGALLYRDNEWLLGMALLSDAAARLNARGEAPELYRQLEPFAGLLAVGPTEGAIGPVDYYLGLLARLADETSRVEQHFREAVRLCEQMGALPGRARAQAALADARFAIHGAGDSEARVLRESALRTAEQLGLDVLADEIRTAMAGTPSVEPSDPGAATLRRDGEIWSVEFAGHAFLLRNARGLNYLARLLATPHREFHALDLARENRGLTSTRAEPGLRHGSIGDAGPLLDAEARSAYRTRVEELRAELVEAEEWNDGERAARLQQELEIIANELGRATGLGGRDRVAFAAAERARISVTRAIRSSIARIGDQSPVLERHLTDTIHTGTFCSYRPDERIPVSWEI